MHPWIFSGAVDRIKGKPENGEVVTVTDHSGAFLAKGFYNDHVRIAVRVLEWNEEVEVDEIWWRARIQKAVNARKILLESADTNVCRVIFSEADFLPGLIVDKYADYLSVQFLTSGIDKVKDILVDELVKLLKPKGIFDRSDTNARGQDGLRPSSGLVYGDHPPDYLKVIENGISYHINIAEGQKSGFFCDQRENRRIVAQYAKGKRMLDCFSYSGGFTLNALKSGAAEVVSVDSSAQAIETLRQNIELNKLDASISLAVQDDVNKYLRILKEENKKFDIVVLDPPKYAPSRSSVDKASRAYKDLNRVALSLLDSGGLLATFSCSGAVDIVLFKQILAWAALDAGKEIQFIYQFSQPEDHPVRSSFPEGEYLKGLLCRVI